MVQLVDLTTSEAGWDACSAGSKELMPLQRAAGLADLFKALSDPTRVVLLSYICSSDKGTVCACNFPDLLGISQPTLSHHLKKLVDAGLVTREQRGRWAHYTAVPEVLALARDFLSEPGRRMDGQEC